MIGKKPGYVVIGTDPSAVLDKFKRFSLELHLSENIVRFFRTSSLTMYTTTWYIIHQENY
jgi:hypothetical protein